MTLQAKPLDFKITPPEIPPGLDPALHRIVLTHIFGVSPTKAEQVDPAPAVDEAA